MAKPDKATEATENTEATGAETPEADDGRFVTVTDPDSGEKVKRVDWIRKVFQDKNSPYYGNRGAIAKQLTKMQGKKVPYQIVFAATKELKAIAESAKAERAAAEGAESTEDSTENAETPAA